MLTDKLLQISLFQKRKILFVFLCFRHFKYDQSGKTDVWCLKFAYLVLKWSYEANGANKQPFLSLNFISAFVLTYNDFFTVLDALALQILYKSKETKLQCLDIFGVNGKL